jgi:hypothetical protein
LWDDWTLAAASVNYPLRLFQASQLTKSGTLDEYSCHTGT